MTEMLVDPRANTPGGSREVSRGLRGNMGTTSVVFMTIACMSPLTAVAGYVSLVIAYGNGLGAPSMYLVVGLVAVLFAVGYLAMVKDLARPGGLYAYITAGLGKRVGLGGGFVAMATYLLAQVGLSIFGGISLSYAISTQFSGPELPWYWCAAPFVVLAAAASYFNVGLSAKLLGAMLITEMIFVIAFNVMVLGSSDASHYAGAGASFTLPQVFSGAVPLAFLFALSQFSGFESPSLYFEETKNPQRTVARATYIIIAVVAVMYSVSAWSFIVGFGPDTAVPTIVADPTAAFATLFTQYLGTGFYQACTLFILTGIFASVLAGNNILSRYLFNCGVDGVLPRPLGRANRRTGAPGNASLTVGVLLGGVIAIAAVVGGDPNQLLALLSGAGTYGFLVLFMLGSIAVVGYFGRKRKAPGPLGYAFFLAPITTAIVYGAVLVYVTGNLSILIGDNPAFGVILTSTIWLCFLAGVVQATYLAVRRPDTFARIGRDVVPEAPLPAGLNNDKGINNE